MEYEKCVSIYININRRKIIILFKTKESFNLAVSILDKEPFQI